MFPLLQDFNRWWLLIHSIVTEMFFQIHCHLKMLFDKKFFWLLNRINLFPHIFACRHCRWSTNHRALVSFHAKVAKFNQSESSCHHKWQFLTNQRALNKNKQLTSVIKNTKCHIKIKQVWVNPIKIIKRTFLYSNELAQASFVIIEEIKTYLILKSGEIGKRKQTP